MTKSTGMKIPITFRTMDYQVRDLDLIAEKKGFTRSDIVNEAIQYYLKDQPLIGKSTRHRIAIELLENKGENLLKNLEKFSNLSEIEQKMHEICSFLTNFDEKKGQKSTFYLYINDLKYFLLEIAEADMDIFLKCKGIINKNTNKRLYNSIFSNDRQMMFPE